MRKHCTRYGLTQAVSANQIEKKTIRIGFLGYEGFIVEAEDGSHEGYGVEFLNEIADYTNWKYEYVLGILESQLENLRTGSVDFIMQLQKTPEREAEFLYSDYIVGFETNVLYVRGDEERYYYNDYENYDGIKIAFIEDSYQAEILDAFIQEKGFTYERCARRTQSECFRNLDAGVVDAVAIGSNARSDDYKIISRFGQAPFYAVTNEENIGLMQEMNDAMEALYSAKLNYYESLTEKYYGDNSIDRVVFTREEAECIKTDKTCTIAFIPNRRPYSYVNEDGEINGIIVELVREIEKRSGLHFNYVMMEAGKTVVDYLEENPEHFVAGVSADNQQFRNSSYQLSELLCSDNVAIVSKPGTEYRINAEPEFYRLAVPKSLFIYSG